MGSSLLSESISRRNVNYLASLDLIISLGFRLIMPLFPLYFTFLADGETDVGILFFPFMPTRA